jgi:hypothetical protein
MSQVVQHPFKARQQPVRASRRARTIALVTVAIVAAMIVVLGLALRSGDSPAGVSAPSSSGKAGPFGGVRYDGGPHEGTSRGAFPGPAGATLRPDGGPKEGTRGPGR